MTTKQIASLIDEALALDRQIAALQTTLTEHKQTLVTQAERMLREDGARVCDPQNSSDLAGRSFTFDIAAAAGVATVSFPKHKLISAFHFAKPGGQETAFRVKDGKLTEVGPIRQLAGDFFDKLFTKQFKPAKSFRDLAAALLPKHAAAKLLALCEEPSSPRVSFETKPSVP